MTGDEEEPVEHVQVVRNVTNVVQGDVFGTLVQFGSVGELVLPQPKAPED